MHGLRRVFALVALSSVMAACGGGGGGGGSGEPTAGSPPPAPAPTPTPPPPPPPPPPAPPPPPPATSNRMLGVSQFGEGTVRNPNGVPFCNGHVCTNEYARGTVVTLTAVPAGGWALHHWTGCDTQTGSTCTVTLDIDKTVHPWFVPTTPPVLRPEAVELTAATMSQLTSNQGGVLIFGASASQIRTLKAGSVIYSTVGDGLLRRVASVIALPGSSYIVDTTDATVADVIAEGAVIVDGRATAGIPQAVATLDVDLTDSNKDGFRAKATLDMTPEAGYVYDLAGVKEAKFTINPKLTLSNVTFGLKEGLVNVSKTLPTGLNLPPIVAGPVVFKPVVDFKGAFKASVKVGVELNGSAFASAAGGVHWVRGAGLTPVGNLDLGGNFAAPSQASAKGTGEADASFALVSSLLVYGAAGPSLDVGPYLKAEGSDTVSATEACIRWSVKAGLRARAGGQVKVLGYELGEWKLTFADISRTLLDGSLAKCEDKEPPTQPGLPSVTALSPTQLSVSWPAATDNVAVTSYTVIRNTSQLQDVGLPSFVDGGLKPNTEYCYRVIANDKAGNKSKSSDTFCGRTLPADKDGPPGPGGLVAQPLSTTSIQLTWTAPTDPSGIAGYVILVGDKRMSQVTGTTAIMPKLQPNTRYCFRVAAIDKSGNLGTASAEVCTMTLANTAWNMKIKCTGQDYYVVEKDVDLDVASDQTLSVVGNATDYNGGPMAYQLVGAYAAAQSTLDARINWTFANSNNVRADEFAVRLDVTDTGNVTMNQVKVTGCTAQIRFVRKSASASSAPMNAPGPSRPGISISGQ